MSPATADHPAAAPLRARLLALDATSPDYATQFVDQLLAAARTAEASDVHLQPGRDDVEILWRLDGVLQPLGRFPSATATNVIVRLKVVAGLLTYRQELPQEGRIRDGDEGVEMRVSTFPTLHGERAVVRLLSLQADRLALPSDLGLPADVELQLAQLLTATSGAIVVVGPAGSGKTTTAYACLRELAADGPAGARRSIVSLEDPIESALPGVAQSEVNEAAGLDLVTGLRSLLRQDPEVILVGEIRDAECASIALQAALTGQLVLTTFHAPGAATAISRLADMGLEPYVLRSGILAIVAQRLVRRLCAECRAASDRAADRLGLDLPQVYRAVGCDACRGTGYRGRFPLAELLVPGNSDLGRALLDHNDAASLESLAVEAGMTPLRQQAVDAVAAGETSPAELRRVFGVR